MVDVDRAEIERKESARTIPPGVNVAVRDFDNADAARVMGETVLAVIRELSRTMDLSRLDGVTIGIDYDAALASVDRGMPGLRPLSRSDTKEMQGVAMSPAVIRNGEVRTHLVFNAEQLVPLIWHGEGVTEEDRAFTFGMVAHECAHVQVTADKRAGHRRLSVWVRGSKARAGQSCFRWPRVPAGTNNAVCRISAPFAASQNELHALTVFACAEVARDQANDAISELSRPWRYHRLIQEAGPPVCGP